MLPWNLSPSLSEIWFFFSSIAHICNAVTEENVKEVCGLWTECVWDHKQRFSLAREIQKCANSSLSRLRIILLSVFMQQKYFFSSSNLSSAGRSHIGSLFKVRKRLAHDVVFIHFCQTCQPCSWRHRHRLPDTKMAALTAVFSRL